MQRQQRNDLSNDRWGLLGLVVESFGGGVISMNILRCRQVFLSLGKSRAARSYDDSHAVIPGSVATMT